MLRIIGAKSIDDLYTTVPKELRYNDRLPLEEGIPEEGRLRRHVTGILSKNTPATEMLSFLGAGCYQHEVPAVCDEINRRGEFVTSYAGDTYGDHGRLQALWEFQDLMAELVELDVVTTPNYDWSTAAAMALRSSVMLTGRKRVLVPAALLLDRRLVFADYLSHDVQVDEIPFNEETGLLDLDALRAALAVLLPLVWQEPFFHGHDNYDQLVKIANATAGGRLVSVLEGGYKVQGRVVSPFARSVAAHVRALHVAVPVAFGVDSAAFTFASPEMVLQIGFCPLPHTPAYDDLVALAEMHAATATESAPAELRIMIAGSNKVRFN
jgi:glycine cleavage system pyridoxal-binding protein P